MSFMPDLWVLQCCQVREHPPEAATAQGASAAVCNISRNCFDAGEAEIASKNGWCHHATDKCLAFLADLCYAFTTVPAKLASGLQPAA